MRNLAELISRELRNVLDKRGLSVTAAAKTLKISRQAMHAYLNGTSVPRQAVLERAVRELGLELQFGQVKLDVFPEKQIEGVPAAEQLDLLKRLEEISQKDLKIAVKRVGARFELEVRIDISAA